ncbi:MAG TPA: type II toxin-antitoxin system HicA family toxin [Gemmatales bacterium]|nr:type II toxin-antitoxin system HicA family toxin [Gemmatales bacterium]
MKHAKLLQKAIDNPANLRFGDLVTLVRAAGFTLKRISGSHNIFAHPHVFEQLNLQNVKGKAKPYQVKQFLDLVDTYNLSIGGGS